MFRPLAALVLLVSAVVLVAGGLTLERIDSDRDGTLADIQRDNSNLAIALEAHTATTLRSLDRALALVVWELEAGQPREHIRALIASIVANSPLIAAMAIADASGEVIEAAPVMKRITVSDRDFFAAHRDGSAQGAFVGKVVTGRLTGRMIFPLSRRLAKEDGSFNGVVLLGIDPAYFTTLYREMRIGREGLLQIVGRDGIARVRRSGDALTYGNDLRKSTLVALSASAPSGSFLSNGQVENKVRYMSYRTLPEYGLVVAVGQLADEALAPFYDRRRIYYLTGALVIGLMVALAGAVTLANWRELRAAEALGRSEALHRATFDQAAVGIAYNRLDGSFIAANRAYCLMTGYSEPELLKMRHQDLFHPDEHYRVLRIGEWTERLRKQGTLSLELRHLRKDGVEYWLAVEVALVLDPKGEPDYTVAIAQDVTDRKRASALLLEQLDELRRFQAVAVDRELRMEQVEEENRRLKEGVRS
ncbi:MAG: PAS domain S-box protein [Betaproteobacteria bacterium]|nr:PAS domain S-box protein [Betaproteobacteria bacterium]